eukprot:CAMPEP_0175306112 /NCGR_PEP_ID=MMETSP0093-20121207/64085_1 /TAXON_ID=311494 /ORGANISM="Alexandrium monilatum, Strain CCMP3105" /LENGTH=152 /DNA_ID=CAMNT_0016602547 /DNA_START=55 /DNA_END=509 /DNA_ORIENTATION=+
MSSPCPESSKSEHAATMSLSFRLLGTRNSVRARITCGVLPRATSVRPAGPAWRSTSRNTCSKLPCRTSVKAICTCSEANASCAAAICAAVLVVPAALEVQVARVGRQFDPHRREVHAVHPRSWLEVEAQFLWRQLTVPIPAEQLLQLVPGVV